MVVAAPSGAPRWVGWQGLRDQAETTLGQVRDALISQARVVVESDESVARGLERVVAREQRDLLVVGSSRHGLEGHVRIGKRTRQLLGHAGCALAFAPRGMRHKRELTLTRIGVGYDSSPEAEAALTLAGLLAHSAEAQLHVHAVVDDRGVPPIDWSTVERVPPAAERDSHVRADVDLLQERALEAIQAVDPKADIAVHRGRSRRRTSRTQRARRPDRDRIPALGTDRTPAPREHRRSPPPRRELPNPRRPAN